jgi:hypothetical protein
MLRRGAPCTNAAPGPVTLMALLLPPLSQISNSTSSFSFRLLNPSLQHDTNHFRILPAPQKAFILILINAIHPTASQKCEAQVCREIHGPTPATKTMMSIYAVGEQLDCRKSLWACCCTKATLVFLCPQKFGGSLLERVISSLTKKQRAMAGLDGIQGREVTTGVCSRGILTHGWRSDGRKCLRHQRWAVKGK